MQALDAFLAKEVDQFEPEIRDLTRYALGRGGKRLRPALVFFAGWQGPGEQVSTDLVKVAAVIEMVHLATLVHDDILDSASVRHGRTTASRKFGADNAVLLGDALFAHAVNLSTEFASSEVCRLVSRATRRVCAGEIAQNARRGQTDLSQAEYYRLIELKTAELFQVSCFLGAFLGGYDRDFCDAAARFGLNLGVGYQVYDDLTDIFGREQETGKTMGTDLASGKYTLPAIRFLAQLDESDRGAFVADIRSGEDNKIEPWLSEMVERGIYPEVVEVIRKKATEAEAALSPFEDLPPRTKLAELTGYLKKRVRPAPGIAVKS